MMPVTLRIRPFAAAVTFLVTLPLQIVYLFIDMAKRLLQVHHAAAAELEDAEMELRAGTAVKSEMAAAP